MRRTTALVNWADQHEKGRAVEVLVMEAMSKLKAAMRKMVEIPQKWQNTPSIAFNGRVGEWKQFKKTWQGL